MMKTYLIGLLSIAALLTGCSTAPSMSFQEKNSAYVAYIETNELESLDKIRTFRLHGWQSLTNDYLIVTVSPNKKYLLAVNRFCPDLTYAQALIFHRAISSTLSTKFDSISVYDSSNRNLQIKCHIKTIHKITKDQAKEISAIGKAKKVEES